MKLKILAASAIAISGVAAGTSASAVTVQPDFLIIESNKNRGNGNAVGDVNGTQALGLITGTIGIAGRIVDGVDAFSFTSLKNFNLDFVNLLGLDGLDIDDCEGFDGSDCSQGSENNEADREARFSLYDGTTTTSVNFTSNIVAGTSIFSNIAAGSYTFSIKGLSGSAGSTYDVAISPVPVPAGLPLLLTAIALTGFVARRKQR